VSLIEEHVSADPDQGGTSAAISRVVLAPGAKAGVFYVQELGGRTVHFWHQSCVLGQGAELIQLSLGLGTRVSKTQVAVELKGTGSSARLFGILFGSGSQHFDPHTTQHHTGPKTHSDMLFRSVLRDKARSIYTGLIRIEKEARETEAYQADHNLLLSSTARADSTPVLEILTDAVRCKHGATAGPLPAEELFYLGCRGIPEPEAKRLLVLGFFEPILSRLPEALRVGLAARVEARLEGL
jgi:Fe-S cluster assembly protein SufD